MDITQLIADDRHEQRRLFAALLEVHAKAEEKLFHPELRLGRGAGSKPSTEAATMNAIHDHNQIRNAVAAVGA